ncbi:MAG: HlyD family efflux transporter periplasmic adaptor subunit [Deltaproteobacteria bacterium]|nr:HlyD family efflux transporter periplasmic adaptor subunit [Deltaproteobacteria bacterium]
MIATGKWTRAVFHAIRQVNGYLLLSIFSLSLSSCGSPSLPSKSPQPMAVRIAAVRIGHVKDSLRYVGTVHSRNEIKVLARVAGKVAQLPIKEGETADRGDVLARIAAPEMNARVSRLKAEVARARKESAFLCRQAEVDQRLLSSNAISKVKDDASRQKCASSRAALKAARAGLNELKVMAGNTVESAPFPGTVLQWLAEPGENLMPGRPILMFGDAPLEIRVQVYEKDVIAGIGKGTSVILLPDPQHEVRAAVASVSPMAVGPGRMVEIQSPSRKRIPRVSDMGCPWTSRSCSVKKGTQWPCRSTPFTRPSRDRQCIWSATIPRAV